MAITAVIEGTRQKRGDRVVQKLLYSPEKVAENPGLWHMIDPAKAKEFTAPLIQKLRDKTWVHQKPKHKERFCRNRTAQGGKMRNLYIPCFEDHIIAHMIMQASMPAFIKGMHPDCCGSVPGRGIKHILKKGNHWFRDDRECRYFVKLDIRKFFESIDRDILKDILASKIKDKDILWAHYQIIDSAPVACPVGYYTSPWYANLYLEKLDWYVEQQLYKVRRGKRIKYVRHFLRYSDDMLLIGTSKADLKKAIKLIQDYLTDLKLSIKPTWEIKRIGYHIITEDGRRMMKPGTYWCDIGGYKFCRDGTIMRDRIFIETRRIARSLYKNGGYSAFKCKSLQSRLGWAEHADSKAFIEREIMPYVNLKAIRRHISDVDKKREQRGQEAQQNPEGRGLGACQEKHFQSG